MSTITATVSTTVSAIPPLRHRDTVINFPIDQDDFVAKYEATNDHLSGTTVAELNAVGDQIDLVASQMNTVAGEVNTNAGIATTKAGEALEHAIGDLTTTGGSAKAWATDTASPDGTTAKSAKTWAGESAASASAALASENAAELAEGNTTTLMNQFQNNVYIRSATPPASLEAVWFDTTVNTVKIWNGTTWVAAGTSVTGMYNRDIYVATAGQTTFASTYDIGSVNVYVNGLLLLPSDYTASNGTSIILNTGVALNDVVDIMAIGALNMASVYTKAEADTLLSAKQATLVSGTNIKTINGTTVLGSGDITIQAGIGAGGAVANVPLTLTSTSSAQQSLTVSAYNQAVTLPDATTLSEGVNVFGLYNNSPYAILVKDNGGNLLGFISSNTQVNCSLADNTTANGTWNLSGEALIETVGQRSLPFNSIVTTINFVKPIRISPTSILILSTTSLLEGVVYNETTGVFGNVTTIRNSNVLKYVNAIRVSDNVVLVVSCLGTAMESVVLTITDTSIAVGAATTTTLVGAIATTLNGEYITISSIGTSYLIGYARATTVAAIRALTISGTTVTVGVESTQSGAKIAPVIYDMGSSIAMVISQTDIGNIYARPVTVSNTTITNGTESTIISDLTGFVCRRLSSGRIALIYQTGGSALTGAIVSLNGTVATSTIASLGATGALTLTMVHIHQIENKLIVVGSGSSQAVFTVLTDSAGTAVAGTISLTGIVMSICALLGKSSNYLYVIIGSSLSLFTILKIGISGNNPIVTEIDRFTDNSATLNTTEISNSSYGIYKQENSSAMGKGFVGKKISTRVAANSNGIGLSIVNGAVTKIVQPRFVSSINNGHDGGYLSEDTAIFMIHSHTSTNFAIIQIIKAV